MRPFLAITLLAAVVSLSTVARAQADACQPVVKKDPAELPPAERTAGALADSILDGLRQALVRRAAEAGVAPKGIVVVEIQDRASGRARALTFAGPLTAELAQAVIDESAADMARWPELAARPGQRPRRESEPDAYFAIRLDPLQQAELVPGQTYTECLPVLRGRRQLSQGIAQLAHRWRLPEARRVEIDVRFLLSRDGRMTYGRMMGSPLTPDQEIELMETLRRTIRFRPARMEGVPADVWVDLPIDMGVDP